MQLKKNKSLIIVGICIVAGLLLGMAGLLLAQTGAFDSEPVVETQPDNCYGETLRVITDIDYLPYSFYDDAGTGSGHDVELMNLIANELHMNLDLRFLPWNDAISAFAAGEADVLMTCDYSDTFAGVDTLLKTEPVSTDEFVVYSKEKISSIYELYSMKCAVMENGNALAQIKMLNLNNRCRMYPDNRHAMLALENGEVDCAIMRNTVGEALLKELGLKDVTGYVSIGESYMCFGIADNNEELAGKINSAIETLKLNGELQHLQKKWLTSFVHTYTLVEILQNNVWAMLLFAALIVCILLVLIQSQRRKMRAEAEKNELIEIVENLANDFECVNYVPMHGNKLEDKAVLLRTSETLKRNIPGWDTEESFVERMRMFIDTVVAPEDRERVEEQTKEDVILAELQKEGAYFVSFKAVIDGEPRYYQIKFSTVLDEESQPRALVLGVHNVDEETRREIAANEALQNALSMAQSANRAKTAFLNNMSHDIRTPMNAIIGYTGLAESHLDNTGQVSDYLGKIKLASRHLLSLINDVLDMSRIESGKMHLEEKPENMREIIQTLRDIVQADVQAKHHHFYFDTVNLTDDGVICDRLRLNQVLLNILSNAIKYTPDGGTISARVEQKGVKASGYATYEFAIRDNGIGMSEDFLQHIFDPFSRAKSSTVSGIQGTGLGMAITKTLIDLMGGKIAVHSEPDKGTEITATFEFMLDSSNAEKSAEEQFSEACFEGKKILLAEDNEFNREIATEILREAGFAVETAEDGDVAVEKIKTSPPGEYDLILMDIQMPRMDGYAATKAIRALDAERAKIPILAMTANAFEEDRRASLDAGMNEHIAKPIDVSRLKALLAEFLKGRDEK